MRTSSVSVRASLVLSLLSSAILCSGSSPPVKVSLRTSWPSPPFLLELIETISLEEPNAFFPLLDALTSPDAFPAKDKLSPEAQQQLALETALSAGYLSKPGAVEVVQAQLALHAANPKIVAFYEHYSDNAKKTQNDAVADAESCGSWVDWYGEVVCDVERLVHLTGPETLDPAGTSSLFFEPFPKPHTLAFDHIYPTPLSSPQRTAILYASFQSTNFRQLHSHLLRLSSAPTPRVQYILRPIPPDGVVRERGYLSGYGVTLDLKKMDYLALDDRGSHSRNLASEDAQTVHADDAEADLDSVILLLEQHPLNTTLDVGEPLTKDEIAQIGILATQLVSESPTPLQTLKHLVHDFPKYATSLARRIVPQSGLLEEISSNSYKIRPGVSAVWLNGAPVSPDEMNPYSLLRLVRKERDLMFSLTSLGLLPGEAFELVVHPSFGTSSPRGDATDGVFDSSDRAEDGDLIFWWNDIEKDSRYARWQPSIYALLHPTYPGQAPTVRRNMFNVVFVFDLSRSASLHFITNTISMLIDRSYPIRLGIVPVVETEEGARMARVFYYLTENYGRGATMRFFSAVLDLQDKGEPELDWSHVKAQFEALTGSEEIHGGGEVLSFDVLAGSTSEVFEARIDKARAYAQRLGTDAASSPNGHTFINGKYYALDDNFLNPLQSSVGQALQYFQEKVYAGAITDDQADDIENHFYDLPTTMKRRNRHIVPLSNGGGMRVIGLPDLHKQTGLRVSPAAFIYPASEQVPLSIYVVADLDTEDGLSSLRDALTFADTGSARSRFTFLHNPASPNSDPGRHTHVSSLFSHLVYKDLLSKATASQLLQALGPRGDSGSRQNGQTVLSVASPLDEIAGGVALADIDQDDYQRYVHTGKLVAKMAGLAPGASGLFINGRIVGPIAPGEFTAEDYRILEDYEMAKRVQPVLSALGDIVPTFAGYDRATAADVVSMVSSVMSTLQVEDPNRSGVFNKSPVSRNQNYKLMDSQYTAFTIGDNTTALHRFVVILDPLSEQAQKYTSLFEWLSNIPTVTVEFHLQPPEYSELPLKRFYRYNLVPSLTFDDHGHEVPAHVFFRDLPIEPIYTLGLDEPSSWVVRPREALYDLDNVQLGVMSGDERQRGVEAVFELDYIIVGGHAREMGTNSPPRGVQLQLAGHHGRPIDDTLIVENLGYLQFKATPGVYHLEIREGRGREVFWLESAGNEGWLSPPVEEAGNEVTVTSFEGLTLYPRLARLPGQEFVDVLEDPEEEEPRPTGIVDNIVSRVSSIFRSSGSKAETGVLTQRHAEINIFTVASGLLYERFASIMVLSVLRNTKHTVKFWFIENFLSPSFLEFIPQFAEEYGFQYELVTYKWPTWLRQQREKQRIIWAYKILFLDVLFPMDLDKVIFVDADQIVRTDLKELIDLDLHGAPYGYTPMGDDNKEMEGFRFWKTGYWEQFLRGRPYHISALYVVDLVRFRQMAAGDILRSHYQQLSADPNSLANLDQDLPNNLQGHVPIFSLHEDWLWCETWCSKDRLDRAKTIDLCQNPLTKEPKLARARQIPEWEQYDAEIARFTRRLADEGRIHASAAAADVNELAKAGAIPVPVPVEETMQSRVAGEEESEGKGEVPTGPIRDEL
ncbi:UDP-glucose:glycoprotein glucosyltransferase-domain-containing protein [Lactarius akahatsu]|uniref:UDP-glucose:glycoprotein glucosyltransferase-domain-containing protein n=1 Tax=Lactarius akahatsu TaxID=416441 RepID=A0AAD4L361_9AGAM|nr:UDP-glucose:glycoprotein glucosyltransferase-domain-containing protein [Lactarius akahatsu]